MSKKKGNKKQESKTITELAAIHSEIVTGGNNWSDYSEKRGENECAKLMAVEQVIIETPIRSYLERLMVYELLLDPNDRPEFADSFKSNLYERLHPRLNTAA